MTLDVVLRWVARIWAAAMCLLWGSFFVEHLVDWFAGPPWPPTSVWLLQLCHLALLAGLATGWKWELAGGVLTLGAAFVFFGAVAGPRAFAFAALTAVPALLWIGLAARPQREDA